MKSLIKLANTHTLRACAAADAYHTKHLHRMSEVLWHNKNICSPTCVCLDFSRLAFNGRPLLHVYSSICIVKSSISPFTHHLGRDACLGIRNDFAQNVNTLRVI